MTYIQGRSTSHYPEDKQNLLRTAQSAAEVELFTIPLYMTALYSIQGTYPSPADSQDLWPGRNANPNDTSPSQIAFNLIYSVFIQEMFHLQLAGNLLSAMGAEYCLAQAMLPPKYDNPHVIPCVGDLRVIPGYEDVTVALGPLDLDRIKLFLAIETPDWDAAPIQDAPTVPYPTGFWEKVDSGAAGFGTIGHLYNCYKEYMNIEYDDGESLFEKVYKEAHASDSKCLQLNVFEYTTTSKGKTEETSEYEITVTLEGEWKPGKNGTMETAMTMIDAIVEQGEGTSQTKSDVVPTRYVPSEKAMAKSPNSSSNAAAVRWLFDQHSHYSRFEEVGRDLDQIETWPDWWAARGGFYAWTGEDLLVAPLIASDTERAFATQRANALNEVSTAGQLNEALNQSFTSLMLAITASWNDGATFPFPAMAALGTRVSAIWAANGVPQFLESKSSPVPKGSGHACQGMDPEQAAENSCNLGDIHTCQASNSCEYQGGCGWPKHDAPTTNGYADINGCQGQGGCGAPIPVAQTMHGEGTIKVGTETVDFKDGDNVYDLAWQVFKKRFPDKIDCDAKPPAANNIRLVLPPS